MVWVMFVEYGVPFLVTVFVLTQLLIPIFRGTPLFPQFRSTRRLELALEEAREELAVAKLKREIAGTEEARDDLEIDTSRIRGDQITEAEFNRLCREHRGQKSDN